MSLSAISHQNLPAAFPISPGLRLSLTTATPVTTTDVTGATTLYLTPYTSGAITIYNGANWVFYTTNEVSLALGTLTNNTNYDVFASYSSGVVLSLVAWTNSTTRATALTRQDGVLVESGTLTNLYVGTIHTTSTTTTEDSFLNRYVWNYYNRVPKILRVTETTASWTYNSTTYRSANGNSANAFNYVAGDITRLQAHTLVGAESAAHIAVTGIGIDTTTVNSAQVFSGLGITAGQGMAANTSAYDDYPAVGSHTINWIESADPGVSTYFGSESYFQSGMIGEILG